MTDHKHRYVLFKEGPVMEMVCECGVNIKSRLTGVTLIEDDTDYELDGRGSE